MSGIDNQLLTNQICQEFYDLNYYNYYSFKLGIPYSKYSTWKHFDIKLPAFNPKMAICLHYIIGTWKDEYTHKYAPKELKNSHLNPNESMVFYIYRQVIEYKRIDRPALGYTRADFKKIKVYSQHQILSWFK